MAKLFDVIGKSIDEYVIEYRIHATKRMFQRSIHEDDVETILKNGKIIERYEEDFPLPSFLINGQTSEGKPLHVVAGINHTERIIVIITAYEPDISRWKSDFSWRKK
jgi:hypothetical protein